MVFRPELENGAQTNQKYVQKFIFINNPNFYLKSIYIKILFYKVGGAGQPEALQIMSTPFKNVHRRCGWPLCLLR